MAIRFFSDNISFRLDGKRAISQWLKRVVAEEGKQCGDLNYIFVSNEKILEINQQFLQHDYYTDIITFENSTGNTISGEMYISIDSVQTNAKDYHVDFYNELLRVMVHGILHLCGYDDKMKNEQQRMRALETKYMSLMT